MTPAERRLINALIAELMKRPRALETYTELCATGEGRWVHSTHLRFVPHDFCAGPS